MVERADGTDSHFIEGDANTFRGREDVAWSPSGKWLVWRAYDPAMCGMSSEPSEQLVIAGAESTVVYTYDWVRYQWSPDTDQLFIVSGEGNEMRWQILDPAAPDSPSASGDLSGEEDAVDLILDFFLHADIVRSRNYAPETAAISADGQWAAYVADGPVIINRATGEENFVAPSVFGWEGNRGGYIYWHPSQNWLISVEEGPAGCGSSYYTQVTDGETRYEVGEFSNIQWLPPQVDPSIFPTFAKPVLPQPLATLHGDNWIVRLIWSDDGRRLYGYGRDGEFYEVGAWDVESGEALENVAYPPLPPQPEGDYNGFFIIAEDDAYVVTGEGVIEKATGAILLSVPDNIFNMGGTIKFSADERTMLTGGVLEPLTIWSLPDGERLFEGFATTAVAISPDSNIVAVASGWDVRLYSRESLGF